MINLLTTPTNQPTNQQKLIERLKVEKRSGRLSAGHFQTSVEAVVAKSLKVLEQEFSDNEITEKGYEQKKKHLIDLRMASIKVRKGFGVRPPRQHPKAHSRAL